MSGGQWTGILIGVFGLGCIAWGSILAGLKGLRASAFFGGLLTLFLPGIISMGSDPIGGDMAGVAFVGVLLLFGWAPVVGFLAVARPGSWWYRRRYDDNDKFSAHMKYERLDL